MTSYAERIENYLADIERRSALFTGVDNDEHHTLYFKNQQVVRYGSNVNDLFFYTQVEVLIENAGNRSAMVRLLIDVPWENDTFARNALRNVDSMILKAVI